MINELSSVLQIGAGTYWGIKQDSFIRKFFFNSYTKEINEIQIKYSKEEEKILTPLINFKKNTDENCPWTPEQQNDVNSKIIELLDYTTVLVEKKNQLKAISIENIIQNYATIINFNAIFCLILLSIGGVEHYIKLIFNSYISNLFIIFSIINIFWLILNLKFVISTKRVEKDYLIKILKYICITLIGFFVLILIILIIAVLLKNIEYFNNIFFVLDIYNGLKNYLFFILSISIIFNTYLPFLALKTYTIRFKKPIIRDFESFLKEYIENLKEKANNTKDEVLNIISKNSK